jgi:predicted peptidase
MSRATSKVKTVITTTPDGQSTSVTTVFGAGDKQATVSVEADGGIVGGGGSRANVRTDRAIHPLRRSPLAFCCAYCSLKARRLCAEL